MESLLLKEAKPNRYTSLTQIMENQIAHEWLRTQMLGSKDLDHN